MGQKKKTRYYGGIQDIINFLEELKKNSESFGRFADKHCDDFDMRFPSEMELQNYINDLHDIIED